MATVFVTCYEGLARDIQGNVVQAGLEPALAHFTVTFTTAAAGSTQLSVLSGTASGLGIHKAMYVRMTATIPFHWRFATASTASGTTTNARTPADVIEFVGVDRDGLFISCLGAA